MGLTREAESRGVLLHCSVEKLQHATRVLFEEPYDPATAADYWGAGPVGHMPLVGLDCEWRPDRVRSQPHPVSLMQVCSCVVVASPHLAHTTRRRTVRKTQ